MLIGLAIVAALLVGLRFTGFEIRDEIELDAPPQKVWQAVTGFQNYHAWNTQVTYLGGTVAPGEKLRLRLSAAGSAPYTFAPVISQWEENKRFAWLARTGFPGIFDGEHFFEIIDLGNGTTRLINREEYRGILTLFIRQLPMMKNAPAGFARMNEELKQYLSSI
jgi:hypothetical protein